MTVGRGVEVDVAVGIADSQEMAVLIGVTARGRKRPRTHAGTATAAIEPAGVVAGIVARARVRRSGHNQRDREQ